MGLFGGSFWSLPGAVWGVLGGSRGVLGGPGAPGGPCWGHLGSKIDFCRFWAPARPPKWSQLGPKLGLCWGQVDPFSGHFGDFCNIQVELELKRRLTLIFLQILGWGWMSRREQNTGLRGSESTSAILN